MEVIVIIVIYYYHYYYCDACGERTLDGGTEWRHVRARGRGDTNMRDGNIAGSANDDLVQASVRAITSATAEDISNVHHMMN